MDLPTSGVYAGLGNLVVMYRVKPDSTSTSLSPTFTWGWWVVHSRSITEKQPLYIMYTTSCLCNCNTCKLSVPIERLKRVLMYLVSGPWLDEVLLEHIVQSWVKLFSNVFYQKGPSQGQAVLKMCTEVLVVKGGHLWWGSNVGGDGKRRVGRGRG